MYVYVCICMNMYVCMYECIVQIEDGSPVFEELKNYVKYTIFVCVYGVWCVCAYICICVRIYVYMCV